MKSPDERIRTTLARLALNPPQSLLLEGGTEERRLEMALFWARTANCPQALAKKDADLAALPCGECAVCRQIQAHENLDLLIYDGRISNRLDEEKPGPIRSLRMENMRELKIVTGTAPHGPGKRVAIFQGMSQTREEAMNSLLKTLEEPSPHTLFVLLAPQRQQMLPTLVSRSFCLTLPWNDCLTRDETVKEWEELLAQFLEKGSAFLDRAGSKGAMDAGIAGRLLLACQRSLTRDLASLGNGKLDRALLPIAASAEKVANALLWLNEAQDMLNAAVTPARVLEAFASRLFLLVHQF